jgi:cytochrome P450
MIDFNGEVLAVHTSTLIGIVSLTLLLLYHRMKPKFPSGIPCPESHHIYGFIPFLLKNISRYPSETTKLCFRHNRTWGAPLPRIPGLSLPPIHLFLFHEDNVKYVLQDNFENYEKGDWLRGLFSDFLGGGIFAADGKVWKNHRKVMSTMFSRNLLRFSATVTRQKLQQILSDMETKISSHSKQGTAPLQIDLKDLMMRLTFDLTTKVAFGVDLNTVSADCSSGHNAYFKAFDAVSYQSFNRLTMKDILWPLKKKLGIGSEKRMKECLDILDNFTKNLISERRTNIKNGIHNPSIKRYDDGDYDLLTQYIVRAQKEGVEVSDQELRDIILNVSLAGEYIMFIVHKFI